MRSSALRRILGIALAALAGCVPLWSQQLPAAGAEDGPDPPSFFRVRAADRLSASEPVLPDAPSTVRVALASDDASSSSVLAPPPAPKANKVPEAMAVVRPTQPALPSQSFHWAPAMRQSLFFLLIEHGFRLSTQRFTRKATVEGPFFQDWFDSVRGQMSMWDDHDSFWGKYVGHPMQGAIASYIQIQNDPKGIHLEFGRSPEYWKSRMKGLAWSAVYSTQWKMGPVSEGTIGNVGKRKGAGGYQDYVVTPVAGLGWAVTEDVVDRYVLCGLEQKSQNRALRAFARSALNPSRSFANLLRKKAPWYRDTRGGVSAARKSPRPPAPRPAAAASPPPVSSATAAGQPCSDSCR